MSKFDSSFDLRPRSKGSYRRGVDDIFRALNTLRVDELKPVAAFLFYYLACEKLAKIMKGVCTGKKYKEIFAPNSRTPSAEDIRKYSNQLGGKAAGADFDAIFDRKRKNSARSLRDKIIHEIGPSHAKQIVNAAPSLVPKMKKFLKYNDAVIQYLQKLHSVKS